MAAKFWLGDIVSFKDVNTNKSVEAKVIDLTYYGPGLNTFEYKLQLFNNAVVFKYEEKLKRVPDCKRKNKW